MHCICGVSVLAKKQASRQAGVLEKTMVDCYSFFFREVCSRYFQANPIQLGGPGTVVEVDESCFSHRPKHQCIVPHNICCLFLEISTSVSYFIPVSLSSSIVPSTSSHSRILNHNAGT